MSENTITPISSVRMVETSTPTKAQAASQVDELAMSMATRARRAVETAGREKAAAPAGNEPGSAVLHANVSLQFRIDEQTSKLTVFVVDRASRRVLRAIPASEMHKLQAGDILKLTA